MIKVGDIVHIKNPASYQLTEDKGTASEVNGSIILVTFKDGSTCQVLRSDLECLRRKSQHHL